MRSETSKIVTTAKNQQRCKLVQTESDELAGRDFFFNSPAISFAVKLACRVGH
jgi:hypothetical protein